MFLGFATFPERPKFAKVSLMQLLFKPGVSERVSCIRKKGVRLYIREKAEYVGMILYPLEFRILVSV